MCTVSMVYESYSPSNCNWQFISSDNWPFIPIAPALFQPTSIMPQGLPQIDEGLEHKIVDLLLVPTSDLLKEIEERIGRTYTPKTNE